MKAECEKKNSGGGGCVGWWLVGWGVGWLAGLTKNKANSAQLELELGLSWAKIDNRLDNLP